MQMPPSASTGDRDAIVHQVQWCAAIHTPTNCHGELEKYPVMNIKPVKFIMQYMTQAAIKLPSTGDNMRSSIQHTCNLSITVLRAPVRTVLQ